MGRYVSIPIEVDVDELTNEAFAYMQELIPGWEPNEGNLDTWIIQTTSRLAAELREFASDMPEEAFRYFGEEVLLIAPKLSTYASFEATVSATDTEGHAIAAGTVLGVRKPDGSYAGFQVAEDYMILPGSSSVSGVVAFAVEAGSESNALATTNIVPQDSLPWVDTIVGVAPTSGGADGETPDEYMDRLVDEIRLMAPRPITPDDFATLVQRVNGIGRAYPLNLYNADTDTPNQEKCMTVVVTDDDGELVSTGAKTEALDLLKREREVNFLVFVRDPQYQVMDVEYEITAYEGHDLGLLETAINEAISEYLSPLYWGELRSGTERLNLFRVENIVRYLELTTVVNNVPGVDFVNSLTFDKTGGTPGTIDVDISPASGVPVVLPRIGTITATLNPPA